jgi:hypothetical protein
MNGKNAKREKQHSPSALEESPAIHTRAEEKQVKERLAIGPHIVYETIRREGEEGVQAVFASTGMVRIRGGTFQRIFTGSGGAAGGAFAQGVMDVTISKPQCK